MQAIILIRSYPREPAVEEAWAVQLLLSAAAQWDSWATLSDEDSYSQKQDSGVDERTFCSVISIPFPLFLFKEKFCFAPGSETNSFNVLKKSCGWVYLCVCLCQLIPDSNINHWLWADTDQCGKVCVQPLLGTFLSQSTGVTGCKSGFVCRISGRFSGCWRRLM